MIDVEPYICTSLDPEEWRGESRWEVIISCNDTRIYSKSGRRSWLELKEWLKIHPEIYIKELLFASRDNYQLVGRGQHNYFFANMASAWYGTGVTQQHFLGGYQVSENEVLVKKFNLPEVVFVEEEIRGINEDIVQRGLIINGQPKEVSQ